MTKSSARSRVPAAPDLDRDHRLARMARALEGVPKLDDHYARKVALARAGFHAVPVADDLDAVAILCAKRRATGRPLDAAA